MNKYYDEKLNGDAKYIPNFRIMRLIDPIQFEVSDQTGRLWKVIYIKFNSR